MNKETQDIIQALLTLIGIVIFFLTAFLGARWSRKKNIELNQNKNSSSESAQREAIRQGRNPFTVSEFWAGNVAPWKAVVGKVFAIIAIMIFALFLLFATYVVIEII